MRGLPWPPRAHGLVESVAKQLGDAAVLGNFVSVPAASCFVQIDPGTAAFMIAFHAVIVSTVPCDALAAVTGVTIANALSGRVHEGEAVSKM